jgi:hypothetical protein
MQAATVTEYVIDPVTPIPVDALDYPTIASLPRYGLKRHYSIQTGWDSPGFFIGDATNCSDLVCYWNLRAADIPLWFVDPNSLQRYTSILPEWEQRMREIVPYRPVFDRHIAVWARQEITQEITRERRDEILKPFSGLQLTKLCLMHAHETYCVMESSSSQL